jgi:hypothetical protein
VDDRFVVRVEARAYEVDANGHVAGGVLLQYAQHARWECLRAAGIDQAGLRGQGIGPVSLEERIRFHREVCAGSTSPSAGSSTTPAGYGGPPPAHRNFSVSRDPRLSVLPAVAPSSHRLGAHRRSV